MYLYVYIHRFPGDSDGKDPACNAGDLQYKVTYAFTFSLYKFVVVQFLSHIPDVTSLFATPWTLAHQVPLSMVFSRQEYWSGFPFPSPWDLLDLEFNPCLLQWQALAGRFLSEYKL